VAGVAGDLVPRQLGRRFNQCWECHRCASPFRSRSPWPGGLSCRPR
jgi:hypothetical protein